VVDQHTVRAYDKDLDLLERRIAEMGLWRSGFELESLTPPLGLGYLSPIEYERKHDGLSRLA
jgi:hypothetical protein